VDVEFLADVDDDPVARNDLVARNDPVFIWEIVVVGTADTGPPTHSGTAEPFTISRRPVLLSHVRRVEESPLSWNPSTHPTTCMYTWLSCRAGWSMELSVPHLTTEILCIKCEDQMQKIAV